MKKIPYNDFLKSMTMFFKNDEIDKKYFCLRQEKIASLKKNMKSINTRDGLEEYIRSDKESIANLLVVLGISNELFKRVVSMLRIQRGQIFSTEWSTSQTRQFALTDEKFMEKLCNLFLGIPDENTTSHIPGYRLTNFVINEKVMKRLENTDFLDFLICKDFDTQYNSDISTQNINKVENLLTQICTNYGLALERNPIVDPVGNGTRNIQVNYSISKPGYKLPSFYIKYSFTITTSRGQTDLKRSVQDLRDYIRDKNDTAKQIVILDGAGWVGRQCDLKDAWDYSDYCLNLNTLNLLSEIIKQ